MKNAVDNAIDRCAIVYNVRDTIEESRMLAEQATDPAESKRYTQRGNRLVLSRLCLVLIEFSPSFHQPETVFRVDDLPGISAIHRAGYNG